MLVCTAVEASGLDGLESANWSTRMSPVAVTTAHCITTVHKSLSEQDTDFLEGGQRSFHGAAAIGQSCPVEQATTQVACQDEGAKATKKSRSTHLLPNNTQH